MKPWEDARIARGMEAQLAARRARIAAGEKPLGWKLGFGAPAAMQKLGISAPLIGFLMQRALVVSGTSVDVKGWTQVVSEPEIAVRLARDVPPGSSTETVISAIGSLAPAIELADLDRVATADNVDAVLAGNIYQRHVVVGEASRTGGDLADLNARIVRRGTEAASTNDPQALTGPIPVLLVHLADTLAAFGEHLKKDDLVICGSVVTPAVIEPDETVFTYTLDPIGQVSVGFRV